MRIFKNLAELTPLVGQDIVTSDWQLIEQSRIQAFADATGDQQWIHTDPQRAAVGPFGAPIAHGFLTLSLLPLLLQSSLRIDSVKMGLNYGLNKVRFTAPVPVGSRVRAVFHLLAFEAVPPQGMQLTFRVTFERQGSDKPVCVAESLVRNFE
jgi:acyl dehydratase